MPTGGSIRSDGEREALGRRLGDVRRYLGFKQAEVASHLGIPQRALSEIEAGRRSVSALELARLAKLYELEVDYFTERAPVGADPEPDIVHLARKATDLSERDREELSRFAAYLKARSRRGAK